jgi:hypothetical protein
MVQTPFEAFLYGVVAGMYESKKHRTPLEAAQWELEEEAHLRSTEWHPLLANADTSMPVEKYSTNEFYAFLALNCEVVDNPKALDEEEFIIIERNVSYPKLMELLHSGQLSVISSFTVLLGIQKLASLGIPLVQR